MRLLIVLPLCIFSLLAHPQGGERKGRTLQRVSIKDDPVRVEEHYTKKGGQVVSRRFYVDARPVGIWQEFDRKGRLSKERDFNKLSYGTPPELEPFTIATDTTGMTVLSDMPQFPGGEEELFKFLANTVRYPPEAAAEGISGTVFIVGVVDENGIWTTTSVLRGAHPFLDHEAWRVMELMPRWTPGRVEGEPVKVQYHLPIRFTLR